MTQPKADAWRIVCLVGLVVVLVFFFTLGREPLNAFLYQLRQWGPVPFYAAFAVCISIGAPPTPFLLAAGAAFDLRTNLIGCSVAYVCSLSLTYAYAHRLFKRQLEDFIAAKAPFLAGLLQDHPVTATLLIRLTPGFPYVLQNCLLVTICRSLAGFLLLSLPPLIGLGLLYASLGQSLLAGQYGLLLVLLFLLSGVLLVRRHFACRREA